MTGYKKEDSFELPVEYEGKEMIFPASLVQMGYTYKIYVQLDDQRIIFEPDEERNFRAICEDDNSIKMISPGIVKAIGLALEKHLK
ncbi:MAG: hypothetical protein H0X41_04745 [Chitinophagaceae bacterium]|nr:hypothetical protein [Chitinophagaceae bacterium]